METIIKNINKLDDDRLVSLYRFLQKYLVIIKEFVYKDDHIEMTLKLKDSVLSIIKERKLKLKDF